MSGALDAVMKSVAKTLVSIFGTTATLTTPGADAYNASTGEVTEGVASRQTIQCSPPDAYRTGQIDGTRILDGDLKVIVPYTSYSTEPTTSQTVTIRDRTYKIVNVLPYSSGNSEAAWELQLRTTGRPVSCTAYNVTAGGLLVTAGGVQVTAEICA